MSKKNRELNPYRLVICTIETKKDVLFFLKLCWLDMIEGRWLGLPPTAPEIQTFWDLFNEAKEKRWFPKKKLSRFLRAWDDYGKHPGDQEYATLWARSGMDLFGIKQKEETT